MTARRLGRRWLAAAVAAAASGLAAQVPEPPRPKGDAAGGGLASGFAESERRGEHIELVLTHGFNLVRGDVELHADRAVVVFDRDEVPEPPVEGAAGLPRRDVRPPDSRRAVTSGVLAARLQSLASALGVARAAAGQPDPLGASAPIPPYPLTLLKALYVEGNVLVLHAGREVLRAHRLHLSLVDDRLIVEQAVLRLWSDSPAGTRQLVVRGDRFVRQGVRLTGADVSITTCTAGEPHFETRAAQVEIIQHPDDFEVRTAGNTLVFSGTGVLPLPNASFFAGTQTDIPIESIAVGHSGNEGVRVQLDLGGSLNEPGGSLHELLTGRAAHEFRGSWHLGLGYNQERGFPLDAGLTYGAEGLYEGRLRTFYLDDQGEDQREIRSRLDGTPIGTQRSLLQTENRVHLSPSTTLDATAFSASDPAVYSEFFRREYRESEIPESSLYLRHAHENALLSAMARVNAATFSYADDRSLAPFFVEQLPSAHLHVFSEPLARLTDDAPLLLTSSTAVDYLRLDYDTVVVAPEVDTLRADQELELAVPFHVAGIGVRPFVSARATYYSDTLAQESATRWAFSAGVRAATWLARSWTWLGEDGERHGLRHVMSPAVAVLERFGVSLEPNELFPFDETDALANRTEIRLELLNRLQHRRGEAIAQPIWLDLAQTFTPISERDNSGRHLGLFEYELLLAPGSIWSPLPNLQILVEGEHDFGGGPERTFNTGFRFGKVLGLNWSGGYRTDRTSDGSLLYGVSTDLFGRWLVHGGSQFDLETNDTINYTAQVTRLDHDWRLSLGVTFDNVDRDTRFFINFEPTLGSLFQPRGQADLTAPTWDPLLALP